MSTAGKKIENISLKRAFLEPPESGVIGDFVDFIAQFIGIVIGRHQYGSVSKAIEETCRMFGYSTEKNLLVALEQSLNQSAEFGFLVNGITVGES